MMKTVSLELGKICFMFGFGKGLLSKVVIQQLTIETHVIPTNIHNL